VMAWMRVERVRLQTLWPRRCEGIEYLPTIRLGMHKTVVPTEAVSPNTDAGREANERVPGSGDEAETPFADDSTQSPLRGGEKTRRDLPRSLPSAHVVSILEGKSPFEACCLLSDECSSRDSCPRRHALSQGHSA